MKTTYRTALRAKGIKPLPGNWRRAIPQPGDRILARVDQPAIVVHAAT